MSAELGPGEQSLLAEARRATLATIGPDGRPRLVPCCYVLVDGVDGQVVYTPIDDKPKRSADPRSLARVRDIERDARVTLLVDRWDEDWARLAWVRIEGIAHLLVPGEPTADAHDAAVTALRARYRQYRDHALETRPVIAVRPTAISSWGLPAPPD